MRRKFDVGDILVCLETRHYSSLDEGEEYTCIWSGIADDGITPLVSVNNEQGLKATYDAYIFCLKEYNVETKFHLNEPVFIYCSEGLRQVRVSKVTIEYHSESNCVKVKYKVKGNHGDTHDKDERELFKKEEEALKHLGNTVEYLEK